MFQYIRLADQLKQILLKNKQLKSVLYNQNSRKQSKNQPDQVSRNLAVAYSNLSLILNNQILFEEVLNKISQQLGKSKAKESITNKYLFFVMVAQYINTGKIKGGGKLKKTIMSHKQLLPEPKNIRSKINKNIVNIRLRKFNSLSENTDQYQKLLTLFTTRYEKNAVNPQIFQLSSNEYSQIVKQFPLLNLGEFRKNRHLVVQSVSSALPAFFLFQGLQNQANNEKKFDIIDGCSAPGNKTLQLCDYLGLRGQVFAFERDQKRFKLLCDNLNKYGAPNSVPICSDFKTAEPSSFPQVKLILLDPTCSGSGMLTNFTRDCTIQDQQAYLNQDYEAFIEKVRSELSQEERERVQQLSNFQLQLLDHAVSFSPQRISYSTCSIHWQENEGVVEKFLSKHKDKYTIKKVFDFSTISDTSISYIRPGIGKKFKNCIRVDPRSKKSDGFFVTIFNKRKNL